MLISKEDLIPILRSTLTYAAEEAGRALSQGGSSLEKDTNALLESLSVNSDAERELLRNVEIEFDSYAKGSSAIDASRPDKLDTIACSEVWINAFGKWRKDNPRHATAKLFTVVQDGYQVAATDTVLDWKLKSKAMLLLATMVFVSLADVQKISDVQNDNDVWLRLQNAVASAIGSDDNVERNAAKNLAVALLVPNSNPSPEKRLGRGPL